MSVECGVSSVVKISELAVNHENLEVWQLGIRLVKLTYQLTEEFPAKEKYRLVDQMCRAAISIPSNIAEGGARKSTKDFMRFIAMAIGSLAELRTQHRIGIELSYIGQNNDEYTALLGVLGRKLHALYNALEKRNA